MNSLSSPSLPTKEHAAWADAETGVLIHFDMPVFEPSYSFRDQWGYTPSTEKFNPTDLNTDQWLETASKAGAKYAVLTTKHCSGFCLWPTKAHDYHIGNSPWKNGNGDVVGDFIRSCAKFNIKPGFYYSSVTNAYLNVDNPGFVRSGIREEQERYNRIVEQQLTELWSNYGKLFEIWFDGGYLSKERGGGDVLSLLKKLQPDAVVFQGPESSKPLRWVGNEHGHAPYPCWGTNDFISDSDGVHARKDLCGNPYGRIWCPAEADTPIRSRAKAFQCGWFWKEGEDHLVVPVEELVEYYCDTVGRNCNLLMGMVIDKRGLCPDKDAENFAEFGREVNRLFGHPFAKTSGEGDVLEIKLDRPEKITHAVIMEDISQGEKVLSYKLEAFDGKAWIELSEGSCIGHKRIERLPETICRSFRIRCLKTKGTPIFRSVELFNSSSRKTK